MAYWTGEAQQEQSLGGKLYILDRDYHDYRILSRYVISAIMRILMALCLAATLVSAQRGGGRGATPNQPTGQAQGPAGQNQSGGAPAVNLLPGSVEGRVVSTTGEPLRKVSLSLRPNGRGGGNYSTTSATDGSFRFASVDQGNYALTGERTGYVRETLSSPGGQTKVIEVVSEKATTGLELKLTPQSVIAGHVFDEDGDPLQSVNVEAWHYTYPRGRRQLAQVQNGSTNDLGEFRLANLPPGRYFVSATTSRPGTGQAALLNAGRGGRGGRAGLAGAGGGRAGPAEVIEDYVTTYFPNLMEATNASPLDLVAGSEVRGIDIRLMKTRFHRVAGTVAGLPAQVAAPDTSKGKGKAAGANGFAGFGGGGIILALTPRSGAGGRQIAGAVVNPATGTFEFPAVPPGSYNIVAQSAGPAEQRVTARVAVDVGNGDVNNVAVRLQPPLTISGKVTVDSTQSTVKLSAVRLNFTPAQPGPGNQGRNGQTQLGDDGSFQAELAADAYTVEAAGLPDGYYLKSVKLAGREMPDATLDLSYGGGAVEVVLAPSAGDVTGTVQNSRGEPAAGVQVTAVPNTPSLRRELNKLVTSDASGNFTLHGLPPGDYKIFAWEEVETNAWMDRDFRQPFENSAASARVEESAAASSITLRVIERAQVTRGR